MTKSLRRTLLIWLLAPLLTVLSIGTLAVYRLALNYSEASYDRALAESANDMEQLARISLSSSGQISFPQEMHDILLEDGYDKTYFSILDEQKKLVAGDGKLTLPTMTENVGFGTFFYDTRIGEKKVRAVLKEMQFDLAGQQHIWHILVGETRKKRDVLAEDILAGYLVPQALVILLAAALVMLAIRKGLAPLESLRETVAARSHRDTQALDVETVPVEVQPLLMEINRLVGRLQTVLVAQKRFTEDAAHQLRTPLAGLAAQTDLALTQDNPPQTKHALSQIKEVSSRLNHTVTQLLSLARSESGSEKFLQLSPVDLNSVARDSTMEWVKLAFEKGIDLGFESAPKRVEIMGDKAQIREMLDNLLDNALRYIPRGSHVTVYVGNDGSLCVEDNGPGIPLEERGKSFRTFPSVARSRGRWQWPGPRHRQGNCTNAWRVGATGGACWRARRIIQNPVSCEKDGLAGIVSFYTPPFPVESRHGRRQRPRTNGTGITAKARRGARQGQYPPLP